MTMRLRSILSVAASTAAGYFYWQLLTLFWAYWAVHNPIARALLVPGNVWPHYAWVLHPTDFLTSVLVSLPMAALLCALGRQRVWLCTAAAVLSGLPGIYWPGILATPPSIMPVMLWGMAVQVAILPASLLVVLAARRYAPNNSSKPTPFRGAA